MRFGLEQFQHEGIAVAGVVRDTACRSTIALLPVHKPMEPNNRIHLAITKTYDPRPLVVVLGDASNRSTMASG